MKIRVIYLRRKVSWLTKLCVAFPQREYDIQEPRRKLENLRSNKVTVILIQTKPYPNSCSPVCMLHISTDQAPCQYPDFSLSSVIFIKFYFLFPPLSPSVFFSLSSVCVHTHIEYIILYINMLMWNYSLSHNFTFRAPHSYWQFLTFFQFYLIS